MYLCMLPIIIYSITALAQILSHGSIYLEHKCYVVFTDAGIHEQSFKECDFCYFHSQLAILKFSASQISLVKDWFEAIGEPDKHEQ